MRRMAEVLSGRTDHVEWLGARFREQTERVFVLKRRYGNKLTGPDGWRICVHGELATGDCRHWELRGRRVR